MKSIIPWLKKHPKLSTIIFLGIILRALTILIPSFNFDMYMFINYGEIFSEGKRNIFIYNYSYNYSPAIFFIAGFLTRISSILHISYPFVHRTFVALFDFLTLLILLSIAKNKKISLEKTALFFFLNPVSILLSGYHAHVDNIAVFFLLLGSWYYFYTSLFYKKIVLWIFATIGFVIKHILPFQTLLLFLFIFKEKNYIKGYVLFGLVVLLFLITFVPFYNTSESRYVINEYVIGYQGLGTVSGITAILYHLCPACAIGGIKLYALYKYFFMLGGVIFSVILAKRTDFFRALLLSMLFFITFTSAHSAQYLILPIAVGALFPSRWYLAYTTIATIFLIIFQIEVGVSIYIKLFLLNMVWVVASCWFIAELIKTYPLAKIIYKRIVLFATKGKIHK